MVPNWATTRAGGSEVQCYYISEELIKKGWKVEVIYRRVKNTKVEYANFYNKNIKYHTYNPTQFRVLEFIIIFFKLLITRSKIYYNRTDARILRGTCGLYCKLFKKKMIFALANDLDLENIKLYSKYIKDNNHITNRLKYFDAKMAERMIGKYVNSADVFVSQTYKQQDFLKKHFDVDSFVIRNSLPIQSDGNFQKENIIIWVSNIRYQKRPEILCKLADDIELDDWKIYMIGNYSGYENLIESVKNPNFKALGKIPYHEAIDWFKKSKILINTSSHEGFPNTFIQAWYFKTLVISYSFDPDDLLKEKSFGYISDGNYEKFKLNILNAMKAENYSDVLENSFNFAKKEFSIENNIKMLEELLKN